MTPLPRKHRPSIDLARIAAAFGIVWAHLHAPGQYIGYTALALFLVMTGFLSMQSLQRSDGSFSWTARAQRIVLPWLVWSAFFLVLRVAMWDGPGLPPLLTDPWSLLIGSSIHLWFLPFVMLAAPTIPLMAAWLKSPRALTVASVLLVLLSLPLYALHGFVPMPEPLPQWCYAFPPFLYGALAAVGHAQGRIRDPLLAALAISLGGFAMTQSFWSVQLLLSAGLFEALWRLDLPGQGLRWAGSLAFGIYLVHPFFMLVGYKFLAGAGPVGLALFTFAASLAAAALLRWLAPGRIA